jgi:hypothetical protein
MGQNYDIISLWERSRWPGQKYAFDSMLFGYDAVEDSLLAGMSGLEAVYFVDVKFIVAQEYFLLRAEQLVAHNDKVEGVTACLEIYDCVDDILFLWHGKVF